MLRKLDKKEKHLMNIRNKLSKLWDSLSVRNTEACIAAIDTISEREILAEEALDVISDEIADNRNEEMKIMIGIFLEAGWTFEAIEDGMIEFFPGFQTFVPLLGQIFATFDNPND